MADYISTIHQDILNRQLDLGKLLLLPKDQSDIILRLFDNLMDSFYKGGPKLPGNIEMDVTRMVVIYNTLIDEGWLVTRREKNLNRLTDDNS